MRQYALLFAILLAGCGNGGRRGEEAASSIPDGQCLRVELRVDEDFVLDGQSTAVEQLGDALVGALEAGNRTRIVDVSCGDDVTMSSVRVLQQIMLEKNLHRIQFFREPEAPIPYVLPTAELQAQVDALTADQRCVVALTAAGNARLEDDEFSQVAVVSRLHENPDIVFMIRVTDDVQYADFVRVLGDVVGAGAQRVSIRLMETQAQSGSEEWK